jgi:hypothetical protein
LNLFQNNKRRNPVKIEKICFIAAFGLMLSGTAAAQRPVTPETRLRVDPQVINQGTTPTINRSATATININAPLPFEAVVRSGTLWCRPPLNVSLSGFGSINIFFNKASNSAGQNGQNLNPGECGWEAGAMASDAPTQLVVHPAPLESTAILTPEIKAIYAMNVAAGILPYLANSAVRISFSAKTRANEPFLDDTGSIFIRTH